MSHQPFENSLFSEESLTSEQQRALREHLSSCETCRQVESAWLEVHQQFKRVPAIAPSPGFSLRWQERLADRRHAHQRRNSWVLFAFTLGGALILFALLALRTIDIFRSPGRLILIAVYQILNLIWFVKEVQTSINSFIQIATGLIPWPAWFALAGIFMLLAVLWLIYYRKITHPRRIEL
jgi:hypothetical protein